MVDNSEVICITILDNGIEDLGEAEFVEGEHFLNESVLDFQEEVNNDYIPKV